VAHDGAPRALRKNMPSPTPVVIIGRLAVDKNFQGRALGRALLQDALLRITKASDLVGARAVLVHAVDQETVPFYARYGDRKWGFEAIAQGDNGEPRGRELELADILSFIKRGHIRNTVWLTADVHYNGGALF